MHSTSNRESADAAGAGFLVLAAGLGLAFGCASTRPTVAAHTAHEPAFENPGGMWMPHQLASHGDTLRALGLELDPAALTDPLSPPLAAVVSLGGCSASFVSRDGLIITNHHCVQGALQYSSSPEDNLVENGFLARTRAEEKWNGPSARVFVTQAFTDVTRAVFDGLDTIADDRARYDAIETRKKELVARCEAGRPHIRCSVASYFRGAEHHLIEQLEIRDVRLVYAPHRGIGWFGGDEDNWMWPRHSGDFAFYRAYVGKDGMPADHAPDNVPYRPAHHLTIAPTPLRKGDMVLVAGYPGTTRRHDTAAEVAEAVDWEYPRSIAALGEYLAALDEVARTNESVAIKASPMIFGYQNALKARRGELEGLVAGGLLQRKNELEAELRAWIAADAGRQAALGDALDAMAALDRERRASRDRDRDLAATHMASLLGAATTIVRMAEERDKPDAEREPSYQERNWKRIEASLRSLSRRHDPAIDRALLTTVLRQAARHPERNRDWLRIVTGSDAPESEAIDRAVAALYGGTRLADEALRLELLTSATRESLARHPDSIIQLAVKLRPLLHDMEERSKRHDGAMAVLKPRYMTALRAFHDDAIAPDANGTLRVTYGTVRGYRPRPDAPVYEPFTVLSEVVAKHRGQDPFVAPEALLDAARAGRFGAYVDDALGEVPVDFLADLDITGGNSGSPTLNQRGELVGLVFDGNYESMASSWLFMPAITRSIHVDIRYVLWIMDAVDGAHHLLAEMGVEPSVTRERAATR